MKARAEEQEVLELGWRAVYRSVGERGVVPKGQGRLGQLAVGQRVRPQQIRLHRESGLSEAGLIRELQRRGIGRPATYAGIVETLLSRKYAERSPEGALRLTARGRAVLEFLTGQYPDLFDLGFTAQVEQLLDEVAAGEVEFAEAVGEVWGLLK